MTLLRDAERQSSHHIDTYVFASISTNDGCLQIVLCDDFWDPDLLAQDLASPELGEGGMAGESKLGNAKPPPNPVLKEVDDYQFTAPLVIGAVLRAMTSDFYDLDEIRRNEPGEAFEPPSTMRTLYLLATLKPGSFVTPLGTAARPENLARSYQEYCKMVWFPQISWIRPLQLEAVPQRGTALWLAQEEAREAQLGGNG